MTRLPQSQPDTFPAVALSLSKGKDAWINYQLQVLCSCNYIQSLGYLSKPSAGRINQSRHADEGQHLLYKIAK